jgi:surfactin synthase thioesterase subunit
VFRGWERALGDSVELCAVQLPGREWRRGEPCITEMESLVDNLVRDLESSFDNVAHFAFFGYSLGGAISFAIARRMRERGLPLPAALVVAACRAPQLLRRTPPIYALEDYQFLAAIKRFGGMPRIVLDEPELLQMVLPILRADFQILGTFDYADDLPLPLPITVYGGTHDPHASRAELAAWRNQTAKDFNLRLFPGGHFFINDVREQLINTLANDLSALLPNEHFSHEEKGQWRTQDLLPV